MAIILIVVQEMMHSEPSKLSIVLDVGVYGAKIGYCGDEAPKIDTCSYMVCDNSLKGENSKYMAGNNILNANRTDF